jgi:tRNA(Ile)-lysidine synthetase-like protein
VAKDGEIIRPLLNIRRCELEQYLAISSSLARRCRLMPIPGSRAIECVSSCFRCWSASSIRLWPKSLAELAEIARDEEDYWENEISGWLGTVVQWSQPEWTRGLRASATQALVQIQPSHTRVLDPALLRRLEQPGSAVMNASVSRPWLLTEPRAVQRRVLKAIGEQAGIPLEFKHIEEILRFAAEDGPSGKELSLPLGWKLVRETEAMVFVTPDLRRQERIPDYAYSLAVPGCVLVPEIGSSNRSASGYSGAPEAQVAEYNPQQLLRADSLPGRLIVRNWRPGDRFWPAHTKSPKKVKELLQERHVAQPGAQALAGGGERRRDRVDAWLSGSREITGKGRAGSGPDPRSTVGD